MNYHLLTSACFIGLLFSCNANNNANQKFTPVVVDVSQKKAADSSQPNASSSTYNYDMKTPNHTWRLPSQLVEVSGNTWVDKDHLILIEDLNPNLYYVKIDDKNATLEKTIPFASTDKEKFDIEDVTYVNNIVYALWSHGVLFKITNWQGTPQIQEIKTPLKKENNTEGLCYDPVTKQLLIACKDDPGVADEKKSTKAVYSFDMATDKLSDQPFMLIQKKDFEKVIDQKLSFNPSAIAIHPVTHDIYLLTTRDNKGMAVYSHDGTIKSFQFIDKDLMPQPEGICFSPDGKLYISSEGKKGEPGNLFEFDYSAK
ncbi:MAG: SdiA-regulated domain-containing protein [Bacteroidota bacterium]|nr:SdiA-regulated domain-containing protein [Bacteroidota bacterium]